MGAIRVAVRLLMAAASRATVVEQSQVSFQQQLLMWVPSKVLSMTARLAS